MINKELLREIIINNEKIIDDATEQSVIFDKFSVIDLDKMPEVYQYIHRIYRLSSRQKTIFEKFDI